MLYVGEAEAYIDLIMEVAISGSLFAHIRKKKLPKKLFLNILYKQ